MDVLFGAKQRMNKMARSYRIRSYRAKTINFYTLLIIKILRSQAVRAVTRLLFLAMVLLSLTSLVTMIRSGSSSSALYRPDSDSVISNYFKILPILCHDLIDEGLIKKGHKGLIVGAGTKDIGDDYVFLKDTGVHLMTEAGLQEEKVIENDVFDFVFALSFSGIKLIDRAVKNGGMAISPLSNNLLNELHSLNNYRIVYLRIFKNTVVAMRKAGISSNKPEAKKDALEDLEKVFTSRKFMFFTNFLRDYLGSYPRRVFISDDSSTLDWLHKNHAMRDKESKFYDMDVVNNKDGSLNGVMPQDMGVSAWLRKNVKREDYVVMKAEAQVVEEMIKDETLCLVDELFLECSNQWQEEAEKGSKTAYWQCLEMYGKVRDAGIAVHQWWN
ncbi:hypothetical protein Pfo_024562 [Paulownia fortunei]|nr:hypothetical protein Pfo_024562 [Paulownia fortunei]